MYLPNDVTYIIDILMKNGYEAYAVGGCVRDSLLGRTPGDWDITTSAMPEETKALFERTFDTGIEHGTITVLLNGVGYEVTTYRIDGKYEDSRRPTEVTFTRNLREDLLRRDFTINAMAYNERDGIVDIFGGIEDLNKGIIRCVGNANARFSEDALRILRAVRFSAQLGFEIEEGTKQGIRDLANTLQNISVERIQVEMVKLLTSPNPEYLNHAYELGITAIIMPEWDLMMDTTQENIHHLYSVGVHSLHAMKAIEAKKHLRLAAMLHDVGKPAKKTIDEQGVAHFYGHDKEGELLVKRILRRWKFDNETIQKVSKLVLFHDYRMEPTLRNVRRAMNRIGEELFPDYLKLRKADVLAQSEYQQNEKLKTLEETYKIYEEILEKNQCVSLKSLAITGSEVIECGVPQGKEVGRVLQMLLDEVIEDADKNTQKYLVARVRELIKKN